MDLVRRPALLTADELIEHIEWDKKVGRASLDRPAYQAYKDDPLFH